MIVDIRTGMEDNAWVPLDTVTFIFTLLCYFPFRYLYFPYHNLLTFH